LKYVRKLSAAKSIFSAIRHSTLVVICLKAWGWLASSESSTRKKIAQSPLQSLSDLVPDVKHVRRHLLHQLCNGSIDAGLMRDCRREIHRQSQNTAAMIPPERSE
jgi:hypothetical protein